MMTKIGFLFCASAALGIVTPAMAQDRGFSSYFYAGGTVWRPDPYRVDVSDFRNLVAKKVAADGGTLTAEDRTMLDKRWHRIVAENFNRRYPLEPMPS